VAYGTISSAWHNHSADIHAAPVTRGTWQRATPTWMHVTALRCRCVALTHGKMVPAVEDFSQKQELLERGRAIALDSGSSLDEEEDLTFKGERLLTHQQLRDELRVCTSADCWHSCRCSGCRGGVKL
jgi:hypothetical protein